MIIHKATDGHGTWYGSLDGEKWVPFPVEPMAGDEKTIRASLDLRDAPTKDAHTLAARLSARTRPAPILRGELIKRGFRFSTVGK